MLARLQGKIDPLRRNYAKIFAEMAEHREELLAKNFSLTILGKGGGRRDAAIVEVPQERIEAGLLRHYAELPFQVGGRRGLGLLAGGWLGV